MFYLCSISLDFKAVGCPSESRFTAIRCRAKAGAVATWGGYIFVGRLRDVDASVSFFHSNLSD